MLDSDIFKVIYHNFRNSYFLRFHLQIILFRPSSKYFEMKKILCGAVFLLLILAANAQFQDDFDDQSFPINPDWFGDLDFYGVNMANELQLMDTAESVTSVYTLVPTADSTTWEFYFRMDFNPSGDNFLKVYLNSNSPDFESGLNGYYLRLGSAGGDDAIELRRQDNTSTALVTGGTVGAIASSPSVRVRVTRDNNANWQLFADYSGGTNFQLEGTANDATYTEGAYFGFRCDYGVTRSDKFFFDDVLIGPIVQDVTPPALLSAEALNGTTIQLQFNEPLDPLSAELVSNYSLDNGATISNASLNIDPSQVTLTVSTLTSGLDYTIEAMNVADLNNNVLATDNESFVYYFLEPAAPFDILINEFYANPDPGISPLPDAEFIELFNRSDKAINLNGFEIFDAANTKTLSDYIFPPQSYVIICDTDDVAAYSGFGNVLGVAGLFALNDSGDDVGLRDNSGVEIHQVSFTTETYQDDDKDDGGWTLELVNPNLYCQGNSNWRASTNNALGGTPGEENSVFENIPDVTPPLLVDVVAIADNQCIVYFNETMGLSAEDISSYLITNTGAVISADLQEDLNTVVLTISAPFFQDQTTYELGFAINNQITDCSGNQVVDQIIEFTYFEAGPAERYDILINEFYPDFAPSFGLPEKEFVELYNRSTKTINLEDFVLKSGSTEMVTLPFHLLLPNSYVILSDQGAPGFGVLGDTIVFPNFIGLGNEGDDIELLDPMGVSIHSIDYDKSWYQDSDKTDGGWSIELVNPDAPCTFAANWRASIGPSGGTPGRQNSVYDLQSDDRSPQLIQAIPLSSTTLKLTFDKALDEITATDINNYSVDGLTISSATVSTPFSIVVLTFTAPIDPSQIYEVVIGSTLSDCIGNGIGTENRARFAIPQAIEANEIILNEVLYDPQTGGVRFIELYNKSDKVFNVGDLNIADRDADGNDIDNNIEVESDYLLFPESYVVLTPFPQNIFETYTVENPNALLQNSLPSYDDKEDAVLIFVPDILGPKIIDELKYTSSFHNQLLDSEEGVSLERISFSGITQDQNNWQSAAATAGYATPTYLNSQFFENSTISENTFDIPNTTLSPDGDGFEDFLLINYNTIESGWVANIRFYDSNGRLIKRLAENVTLSSNGTFKWVGDTDEGVKARMGIYILFIEIFKSDGSVEQVKKTCVVAGKLN